MIVTLAGHVDHGKTSIVRALTGVDTDRLEEEKRRGLTIDLGFAYTDLDGEKVGFVDVPGHHRFIHNMVAGVASMQHALLVVAVDDGVMPQTREHLQILSLLGVSSGVVALNKVDRADADRVAAVRLEITELTKATFLENAEVVEVSCEDGRGIDQLRQGLTDAARRHRAANDDREFRLAIDRTFNVRGAGLVVTGTVVSGEAHVAEQLEIASTGTAVRVRGLHVQDQLAEVARGGDRTAMNLTGVDRNDVARGDWVVAAGVRAPTQHACIELEVLADFPRSVKHWAPIHLYHATSHAQGRLALIDGAPLAPGQSDLVDLILDEPMQVKVGDRVIVRDQDLGRTLGGGRVLDIDPPSGRRRHAQRRARLEALRTPDDTVALRWLADQGVVSLGRFRASRNLREDTVAAMVAAEPLLVDGERAVSQQLFDTIRGDVASLLAKHQAAEPDSDGMGRVGIATALARDAETTDFVLARLARDGDLVVRNELFSTPDHQASLPQAIQDLYEQVRPELDSIQPPSLGDVAKALHRPLPQLTKDMRALIGHKLCVQVAANRFFLPDRLREMAEIAKTLGASSPFTVRQFRDASGVGRNVVIEVLEYFDAQRYTRREGDVRRVVGEVPTTG